MDYTNINPNEVIFALDIGTRSLKGTVGIVRDKKFVVIAESYAEHEKRAMIDGQIHDISLVSKGVEIVKNELESKLNFKLTKVAIAAAGRSLKTTNVKAEMNIEYKEIDKDIVRSLELTAVKKAEEKVNHSTEGKLYCVGYSVKNYYLNGYMITNLLSHKGDKIAAEVIATFLPRTVVDSLYAVTEKQQLEVVNLTLEPIAAMEAAIPQNLRLLNLSLVDVGAGTSDVAICSNDTINAYGMVPVAGDEVTEVIAKNFLVDFNTAEKMKKEADSKEIIEYIDVLGLENQVSKEDILKVIKPVVDKIADEIASKILYLNNGKAPNAVFLVGGGVHTLGLREMISEKLGLPLQRVAVKGREAVTDCVTEDKSIGSIGVTVLGIALVSIKKMGHDFIDIFLNGSVVSLFNSHNNTVMDVIMQAGIDPKMLIGKNGKNIKFILNDIKRVAFGSLAVNSVIKINGTPKNMDSEVSEGDNIDIEFAKDGKDAIPKVRDFIQEVYSISFYINDEIKFIEPVVFINEERAKLEDYIKDGDSVKIILPETLGEYIKYFDEENKEIKYFSDAEELSDDYKIKEGQRIYSRNAEQVDIDKAELNVEDSERDNIKENLDKENEPKNLDKKDQTEIINNLEIIVNEKRVVLKGKEKYIFIDIFDYIDFQLIIPKGKLILLINGKNAGYYDELNDGDDIKIYWE
ncbi:MAG: cell division FtsA domain-containing protein [Bacillota bacterium]|nr:cell division FtsA domain-containing protein [Bacillota bacterium]